MDWIRTDRRPTYVLAAAVVLCVAWYAFLRGVRVPILGFVDLAIHEAGHVFFLWAPRDLMLVMGNGFQALVPAVFAGAFVVKHRDLAGGAAALAWCASSLQEASVYIADAPYRRLPLLGPETTHDWWQLLGSHGWLNAADELSRTVWWLGLLVWLLALAVFVIGLRWDREWSAGAAGTLYLPWERATPDGTPVSGTLAPRPAVPSRPVGPVPTLPPPPPPGAGAPPPLVGPPLAPPASRPPTRPSDSAVLDDDYGVYDPYARRRPG